MSYGLVGDTDSDEWQAKMDDKRDSFKEDARKLLTKAISPNLIEDLLEVFAVSYYDGDVKAKKLVKQLQLKSTELLAYHPDFNVWADDYTESSNPS